MIKCAHFQGVAPEISIINEDIDEQTASEAPYKYMILLG